MWLLLLAFSPLVAQAQPFGTSPDANAEMPRCGPLLDGQVICKFGTIYECDFVDPNSMERRTGWRWKSDILRSCAEPSPVGTSPPEGLPPGFTYAPQLQPNNPTSTTLQADPVPQAPPTGRRPGGPIYLIPNGSRGQAPGYQRD